MGDNVNQNPTNEPPAPAGILLRPGMRGRRKSVRWADFESGNSDSIQASTSSSAIDVSTSLNEPCRDALLSVGVSPAVVEVLGSLISVDGVESTVCYASYDSANFADGRPTDALLHAMEARLEEVSMGDRRELFGILAWEFTCVDCGILRSVHELIDVNFVLSEQGAGRLKSGPCEVCKAGRASWPQLE